MKLSADDAFALSQAFRDVAVAIGDYRYDNWDDLTPGQRQTLEDEEWSLLNASSDLITKAVGLVLDETQTGMKELSDAAARAKKAVQTLKTVKKVINVAVAAVGLTAAILSKDPGAIGKNAKALYDAATATDG